MIVLIDGADKEINIFVGIEIPAIDKKGFLNVDRWLVLDIFGEVKIINSFISD